MTMAMQKIHNNKIKFIIIAVRSWLFFNILLYFILSPAEKVQSKVMDVQTISFMKFVKKKIDIEFII